MKDDRLRIPIDSAYVEALGRAAYVFATMEWNAVWCCERMQKGYIRNLGRKTAGVIADNLVYLSTRRPDAQTRTSCVGAAKEFKRLVVIRNGILHGKPGTVKNTGDQSLFCEDQPWTPSMINEAADAFAECNINMNHLLYNELKSDT